MGLAPLREQHVKQHTLKLLQRLWVTRGSDAQLISEKKVVKEIPEHVGLPTTGPPIAPAQIPDAGKDAPWQDDVPELQQTLR